MRNFPGLRVQWLCHLGSVLIVSSLFSACGGRTRGLEDLGSGSGSSGHGDGDGDGDPGSGGSSTGGHVGTGGLFPSGGTFGTGGDSTVGTGGVQTGAECLLPAETGECDAAIPRYYYDAASESCKQFTWGGCGGNANNFETITECYDTCFDGDLGARQQCTIAADCTLIFKSCCEPCEGKTPDDYWAINKDFKDDGPWVKDNCAAVDCASCQGSAEVGVTCENNRCVAFDTKAFAACDEDNDCVVRCGVECCNKGPWTALSDIAGLEALVCAPEMSCRTCVDPPEAPRAFCDDGTCRMGAVNE